MSTILTLKQLKKAGACSEYLDKFKAAYGDSVEITEALAIEQVDKWDWNWAAQHLLTPENLAEYERVTAPAWAEYERVKAPAWAEYERVKAQAWARLYIAQGGGK